MKYKKYIFAFAVCVTLLLSGCGKESVEIDDGEFVKYDLETSMPNIEFKICDLTEPVMVYFPVVTNKEITKTELGGVAAKSQTAQGNIKVVLKSILQDRLNLLYDGKYVSFLKYQVKVDNAEQLQVNDSIILCDTTLWIYHNIEFEKVQIDEDYLHITIIENEGEKILPDWESIIANMKTNIEYRLKAAAN